MTNQVLISTLVVLCSLGGWYVILHKYLALKAMVKAKTTPAAKVAAEPPLPTVDDFNTSDYLSMGLGRHVPGMGPAPLFPETLQMSPEFLANMQHDIPKPTESPSRPQAADNFNAAEPDVEKNRICSWAAMMHLSGFSIVTGVLFINVIIPTILWLLKKDQHTYLAKQGREVINFQITLTFIQIISLGLGSFFIWLFPSAAATLLEWTRTIRIVFSTSMYVPFNLFSAVPFIWGCVLMVRGTVAASYGLAFKYPYAQPFIIESKSAGLNQKFIKAKAPAVKPTTKNTPNKMMANKINFG